MTTKYTKGTMSGQERAPQVTVEDAAVRYNAEGKAETELRLQSPWFESQYATVVTTAEPLQGIRTGWTGRVTLRAGNLRTVKATGQPYAGTKPFHYFWDFVAVGDVTGETAQDIDAALDEAQAVAQVTHPEPPGDNLEFLDQEPGAAPPTLPTGASKRIRYARTFNLGNFESERIEIEEEFSAEVSDTDAIESLRLRIIQARREAALSGNGNGKIPPADTEGSSAPLVDGEGAPLPGP